MGVEPAHIRCVPERQSLASMFQQSSGTTAFTLTCPIGTIIDVSLSFRGRLNDALAAQTTGTGLTTGGTYVRGLDGVAKASSVCLPALPPAYTA